MEPQINAENLRLAFYGISFVLFVLVLSAIILLKVKHDQSSDSTKKCCHKSA